jgi:hypothetical protein
MKLKNSATLRSLPEELLCSYQATMIGKASVQRATITPDSVHILFNDSRLAFSSSADSMDAETTQCRVYTSDAGNFTKQRLSLSLAFGDCVQDVSATGCVRADERLLFTIVFVTEEYVRCSALDEIRRDAVDSFDELPPIVSRFMLKLVQCVASQPKFPVPVLFANEKDVAEISPKKKIEIPANVEFKWRTASIVIDKLSTNVMILFDRDQFKEKKWSTSSCSPYEIWEFLVSWSKFIQ